MSGIVEAVGDVALLAEVYRRPEAAVAWLGPYRHVGHLFVWQVALAGLTTPRTATVLAVQNHFTLVAQEFEQPTKASVEWSVKAPTDLHGSSLRYQTVLADGSRTGVHLLGDYLLRWDEPHRLTLAQVAQQGRFLIAVTADPGVRVRPVSGWAIEVRSGKRVWSLMHSNRARKIRPVGPIRTDARFALVASPNVPCSCLPDWSGDLSDLHLDLLDASCLQFNLRETLPQPVPDWVI